MEPGGGWAHTPEEHQQWEQEARKGLKQSLKDVSKLLPRKKKNEMKIKTCSAERHHSSSSSNSMRTCPARLQPTYTRPSRESRENKQKPNSSNKKGRKKEKIKEEWKAPNVPLVARECCSLTEHPGICSLPPPRSLALSQHKLQLQN